MNMVSGWVSGEMCMSGHTYSVTSGHMTSGSLSCGGYSEFLWEKGLRVGLLLSTLGGVLYEGRCAFDWQPHVDSQFVLKANELGINRVSTGAFVSSGFNVSGNIFWGSICSSGFSLF